MKKVQLMIVLALVIFISACSKDAVKPTPAPANFEEIKLTDIQNRSSLMTTSNIIASDLVGVLWKKGNVVIFKTSAGTFGKFEVIDIEKVNNYALVLNITIFNSNGSTKNILKGLLIRGTWGCNLDIPEEDVTSLKADFFWSRPTPFDTYLVPNNGAIFLKYTF